MQKDKEIDAYKLSQHLDGIKVLVLVSIIPLFTSVYVMYHTKVRKSNTYAKK